MVDFVNRWLHRTSVIVWREANLISPWPLSPSAPRNAHFWKNCPLGVQKFLAGADFATTRDAEADAEREDISNDIGARRRRRVAAADAAVANTGGDGGRGRGRPDDGRRGRGPLAVGGQEEEVSQNIVSGEQEGYASSEEATTA